MYIFSSLENFRAKIGRLFPPQYMFGISWEFIFQPILKQNGEKIGLSNINSCSLHFQISGVQCIRKRQEKSTAILIAIIVAFVLCHVHRLAFKFYEMALPENSIFEHFLKCEEQGRYHVPVAIYFLAHSHYFFIVTNSSINFIIYCAMGRQFRNQLTKLFKKT